jgi:hypothetical protein
MRSRILVTNFVLTIQQQCYGFGCPSGFLPIIKLIPIVSLPPDIAIGFPGADTSLSSFDDL